MGSGIELCVCRAFVTGHSGTIDADPPLDGDGTEFMITLPLTQPLEGLSARSLQRINSGINEAVVPSRPGTASSLSSMGSSMGFGIESYTADVLVVDDSLTSRQMISLQFKQHGITCKVAEDGEKALELMQQGDTFKVSTVVACVGSRLVCFVRETPHMTHDADALGGLRGVVGVGGWANG